MTDDMIIFTSICANYLHKARTLAGSVKKNIEGAKFVVCLVEDKLESSYHFADFDDLVLAKDIWEGDFNRFIFKHRIVEAATSVKAQFFKYLFEKYPDCNKFVYLDPDVYVYSDLVELKELLEEYPIIVCPHLLQPGNIEMELSSSSHGVYNLGFLAVNNSQESKNFINWWAERLFLYCYDDKKSGIFTDQKWVGLAPCFFDVKILKHRGYDFAPWSLLDSGMRELDGNIAIKGDPLRFIHFSGFGKVAEMCMERWLPKGDHPFKRLYQEYKEKHNSNDSDMISKSPWSYGYYLNGKPIADTVRISYRQDEKIKRLVDDPFRMSNNALKSIIFRRKLFRIVFDNRLIRLYKREGLAGFKDRLLRIFSF